MKRVKVDVKEISIGYVEFEVEDDATFDDIDERAIEEINNGMAFWTDSSHEVSKYSVTPIEEELDYADIDDR